jgi:hypothetical protein
VAAWRPGWLACGLGLLTVWRLSLLPVTGLTPGESLAAWMAARPWSALFLEHGPLVNWTGRLGMMLAGGGDLGLRLAAPVLALLTSLLAWDLARRWYDRVVAGWVVALLNLTPVLNLAAVTLTNATLIFPLVTGLVWFLDRALAATPGPPDPLSGSWGGEVTPAGEKRWRLWLGGGALMLTGLGLVAPSLLVAMAGAAVLNFRPLRHRWLVLRWEAWLGILLVLTVLLLCRPWETADWRPRWGGLDGWMRWVILASPGLLVVMLWALAGVLRRTQISAGDMAVAGLVLPLVIIDFFWFSRAPWPGSGAAVWMVFGLMPAARAVVATQVTSAEDRVHWRTSLVVLAGLQSILLVNSDFARAAGMRWSFETRLAAGQGNWRSFFRRDPAGAQRGWTSAGRFLGDVLAERQFTGAVGAPDRRMFVIATDWRLAVSLERALAPEAECFRPSPSHPRVHALQDPADWSHPLAWLPRYDGRESGAASAYAGRDALVVTDDPGRLSPPPGIRVAFARWELIAVTQIWHAGQFVRELKIFACHNYRPPQL